MLLISVHLVVLVSLIDFLLLSVQCYSALLELIFSDLWGPSHVVSTNGYLYYITLVDAFSKYTWIYLLKEQI